MVDTQTVYKEGPSQNETVYKAIGLQGLVDTFCPPGGHKELNHGPHRPHGPRAQGQPPQRSPYPSGCPWALGPWGPRPRQDGPSLYIKPRAPLYQLPPAAQDFEKWGPYTQHPGLCSTSCLPRVPYTQHPGLCSTSCLPRT